jgi:Domain of unknown function (DUF4389)
MTEATGYPLRVTIERQAEYSRWLPLVKWLLLVPHYVALWVLGLAASVVIVISWFAVVFTARYPRGLFDFVVGVQRWSWRVIAYLYLMTDSYPPFTLGDDPGYPVHFDIDYPEEGVARWRPVLHWLLVIPYAIVAYAVVSIAHILAVFAFFTILFGKTFPEGMFDVALVALRWPQRAHSYGYWLVTRYPPFQWA